MEPLNVVHLDDDLFEHQRLAAELACTTSTVPLTLRSFAEATDFLTYVASARPAVALVDLHLFGDDDAAGLEVISALKETAPATIVIAISYDLDLMRQAMAKGADDFVAKRTQQGELWLRIVSTYQLIRQSGSRAAPLPAGGNAAVGATMRRIAARLPLILSSAISAVHLYGESGTGKEVVADLLQAALPPQTPFVKVNCGAISASLLESELFGHKKGAFTGAWTDKKGLLEAADGGWVFLDEIGSLPLPAQVALLRALENRELTRVGDHTPRRIDIRILSATNESLERLVAAGTFRNDLWQRLNDAVVNLPPLRDRPGEIDAFIDHFAATERGGPYAVSAEARSILGRLAWEQGNVRQLRNCLRSMTERHVNKTLTPLSLPDWVWASTDGGGADEPVPAFKGGVALPFDGTPATYYAELCDRLLMELLKLLAERSRSLSLGAAAQALGMPKSTLVSRLRRLVDRGAVSEETVRSIFQRMT